MEGLFFGSHNDWLTPVLRGWVTVAVSLGTLQRHHVISTAAEAKQAAFSAPCLPPPLPLGSVQEKLVQPSVVSCCSRPGDSGACPVSDAPFLGPSGALNQQPIALLFPLIYLEVFSQLLSLSCLWRKD